MKYPVGTKCWVIHAGGLLAYLKGAVVVVTSHEAPTCKKQPYCSHCKTHSHAVVVDVPAPDGNPLSRVIACCLCTLVPIDDPDAGVSVEEAEELSA